MTPSGDGATPAVSVLMAVHNGLPFVEGAVRSMMAQSLRDIEIIVVDDASTDATPSVLARLAAEDRRLRVETLPTNLRLAGALNHGLRLARAPYVARMDADDLSHPTRLEVQARYLDSHPGVVAVGTSLRHIDAAGRVGKVAQRPRTAFMCRWIMRFRPPIGHPTAMIRHPASLSRPWAYDSAFHFAQDYDLFDRLTTLGDLVCLPDVLFDFRQHPASISRARWDEQNALAKGVCRRVLERDLPPAVVDGLGPVIGVFFEQARASAGDLLDGIRAMLRHDLAAHPDQATWLRRHTAQFAHEVLSRARLPRSQVARAFLGPGRDLTWPLAARYCEIANLMPRRLSSVPRIWA